MIKKFFLVIYALIIIPVLILANTSGNRIKIVHESNTVYYRIVVYDDGDTRYLRFGSRALQTSMSIKNPDKVLWEYIRTFITTWYWKKDNQDSLLIGLGGGAIVKYLKKYFPGKHIDIAEIDPAVVDIAKKYFFTEFSPNMKVFTYDGRIVVKRINKNYDIISLDAFNSDYIPFHLLTKEFLQEVKRKLKNNGVVLQNIFTTNELKARILNTFKSVFKYIFVSKGYLSSEAVILATDTMPDFSKQNLKSAYETFKKHNVGYDFDFTGCLERYSAYNNTLDTTLILTDEHAPVNFYHRR